MTMIAITSALLNENKVAFQTVSGEKQPQGSTPGEALVVLAAQLSDEEFGTLIIVQNLRPDCFFTAARQQRMKEQMDRWRAAGDRAAALSDELGR